MTNDELLQIIDQAEAEGLEKLDLRKQGLTVLPREIGRLGQLKELYLSGNRLSALPAEIWQLTKLSGLYLSGCRLSALPAEIWQLTNLSGLDLRGNRLSELPAEIGQLTNLRSLSLRANQLSVLPAEIWQLTNMVSLDLSANQLSVLPAEIWQLTNMVSLDLGENQLSMLPAEIWQLTNLEFLNLYANQLSMLPAEIGQLTNLALLSLGANQLSVLPAEIWQLTNLSDLNLRGNQLSELPAEIGQLAKLRELNLTANHLFELPAEIGQLANLTRLDLSRNHLSALPAEIGQLIKLNNLDLRGNDLSALPAVIGQLTNLSRLDLDGNSWIEPFDSLTKGPLDELFTYLRSLLRNIPQYEAKVLLVGEGAVGKTSLLRAFRGDPPIKDLPTTHGIELARLAVPHPQPDIADELTLNFWDFGGQEVYRVTHQFFFSRQALYLLVWKPREGREENALEEWLERIHLRVGSDARVIIVATHCTERRPELDYPALASKYGNILAGHIAVDSFDGTGIDQLKEQIAQAVAAMPHVGTPFNQRWLDARDQLRGLQQTHVTREEFAGICSQHGLTTDDAVALRSILHTLGQIIYYDYDGLHDFVVLKPEWLTKAISYVLEDKPTRDAGGILDHRRLVAIWSEHSDPGRETYPPTYYPYFLRLMEEFDVSVRIEGRDASLVPQLVPYQQPPIPWQVTGGELRLICEMEQNPPGLIAWTTARNHRWSTGTHWRDGVFLRHKDGHEALLDITSRLKRRLTLTVCGEYPAHFTSLLRDGLEALIEERWPYLQYELHVPCTTVVDGKTCQGRFPLQTLQRARAKGMRELPCQTCLENIDVGQLLEGYITPVEPLSQQLAALEAKLLAELAKASLERQALQGIMAESAEMTRRVLRALMDQSRHGPRLFTLSPIDPTRPLDPRNLWSEELRLTLWCEHPGHEHPLTLEEPYIIRIPRRWATRLAPYALLTLKVLRIAAPLAVGAVGLAEQGVRDQWEDQFKFMEQLSKAAPVIAADVESLSDRIDHRQYPVVSRAEGEGLRAFHDLLAEVGWKEGAANLRKVSDRTSGDILWVCPKHYPIYDPGLPILPEQI